MAHAAASAQAVAQTTAHATAHAVAEATAAATAAAAAASAARPFEQLRAMAPTTSTSSLPSLDALGRIAGTEKSTYHSTTILYASHLAPWREHPVRLLEIGVKDGASLKMWDDFFTHPNAQIYGADIVKKGGGIDESRIIQADQSNWNDLLKLQQKGPWNVVVDDGSHLPEHQLLTFRRLFPSITPGGLYIIEGTETSYWKEGAKLEGAVGHPYYNISGEVDIVNTFQRATNLIINREFRCDNLAKLEPIFSDDIDATITSVTFIRKLPEDFIVHTSYRNHNMACDPEGEAEREAVEEAEDEAAEAAKQAEAEAEADDAETQR